MSDLRPDVMKAHSADDPVLAEVVRRLAHAYRPERIYLFGSTARGEAGADSDYDLMVIVPDESSPEYRSCDLAYRVLRGLRVAKDVLVWPRTEFEKRLHLNASLPSTVLREGRLLYVA
jgi:predicted nucleotidyltransferase